MSETLNSPINQSPFNHRYLTVTVEIPEGQKKLNYHTYSYEDVSLRSQGQRKSGLPFRNYRINCSIVVFGGQTQPQAQIQIYNMSRENMAALSQFGNPATFKFNDGTKNIQVSIYAGDGPDRLSRVFNGFLIQSYADFTSAPDPFMFIQAASLGNVYLTPHTVTSYEGEIEAAQIIKQLADENDMVFENNGVTTVLRNPYLSGDVRAQIEKCSLLGNFNYIIENGVIAIWPEGGHRQTYSGKPVEQVSGYYRQDLQGKEAVTRAGYVLVNKQTGLIGYPSFNGAIIGLRTLFRNDIRNGDLIKVESDFFGAAGYYTVHGITHQLSSEINGGPWFTDLNATVVGYLPNSQEHSDFSAPNGADANDSDDDDDDSFPFVG
ncbi:hypothetical protein [Entomobacter blattae]|uniref:Uncharacterized protein n=1 Tax=Entomobacter blattae TaxID=2762277 RepID=A0A7H1NU40_9PROT|nr:hypothetical protein [Entomobacter blattae]QNT79300.1 hypothetical protein JGUZn3_20970 [Entomobacter blattae]